MLFMLWTLLTLLMNFTDLNWHIANIKMTIRKWLTISVGCDCRSSRNPPPPGGAGLAGGGGHWVLLTMRLSVISLWWRGGRGGRLLRYPGSGLGALRRVCRGVRECQGEGLLLEIMPVLSWHSTCQFQHPLEKADPLLMKRVMYVCLWTCHKVGCRIFHNAHDLVQLWGCFIFLTICSVISSFLGSSCGRGSVGNRHFGRRLSPGARAALVPTIICILVRRVFSGRPRCCPPRWFVTLLVTGFEIGEVCKLPLLASC